MALLPLCAQDQTGKEEILRLNRENELQQLEVWETNLAKASDMDDFAKLDFLNLGLRNMAHRKTRSDHGPEVDDL